jgi:hypothetical protein
MRASVFAVVVGLAASSLPARADDCATLDTLLVSRKSLTQAVSEWRAHAPSKTAACALLTDLVAKTDGTIVELARVGKQCNGPTFMINSLVHELYILSRAEDRTCRLSREEQTVAGR